MRTLLGPRQATGPSGISFPVTVEAHMPPMPAAQVNVSPPEVEVNVDLSILERKLDMLMDAVHELTELLARPRIRTISGDPKKLETIIIKETIDG